MGSRLQSVLAVLLACLMLGAGTQSAVCELACELGSNGQCHGASSVPSQSASTSGTMAGMHCSGMMSGRRSKTPTSGVQLENADGGSCDHPSSSVTLSSVTTSENVVAVHWIVVEPVSLQATTAAYRIAAKANAPPLPQAVDSLFFALRV
jgi:hypothetical protein